MRHETRNMTCTWEKADNRDCLRGCPHLQLSRQILESSHYKYVQRTKGNHI